MKNMFLILLMKDTFLIHIERIATAWQITFLSKLKDIGEIRTLFSGEVRQECQPKISALPDMHLFIGYYNGQLILKSELRYFCKGAIVADSREDATGLMVVTAGQVISCRRNVSQSTLSLQQIVSVILTAKTD
jgi:hypothetical protein